MKSLPGNKWWTCLTTLLLSAFVTGCTVLGPDHEKPEVDWLEDWRTDLYGQLANPEQQQKTDLRFWWTVFNDPILNALIETARKENPGLRIAGLRILESRAALGIADSTLYPQIQQATGSLNQLDIAQRGGNAANDNLGYTAYSAGLSAAWELDFWGRFQRTIESADAGFFASIAAQQDVQVLLTAQVVDLYYAYHTTLLRIQIAQKNAQRQQRSYDITRQLFESGQSSELDLQQAKSQYLGTLSTIPQFELALTQISNALSALLGRAPGDLPELADMEANLPLPAPVIIEEIATSLLMRRPDVRTAAWQIAAQSAQIGIAEADFYPAVSLLGSFGWSGDSLDSSPLVRTLAVGPSVQWTIFDWGRIENNVRLQDARLQQTIENFQNTVLLAAQEIDNAAISVIKTREQDEILIESLKASERSLSLSMTLYREGYAGFQRVLDAQRALLSQSDRQVVNLGNHINAVVALYRSIGGGWIDTPINELIPAGTQETMRERTDWGELIDAPLPGTNTNELITESTDDE